MITLIEKLQPVFRPNERITMFIAGCQNCGKSYYISQFLRMYRAFHPERPVFLVTGLSEKDAHFEGFDLWKIYIGYRRVLYTSCTHPDHIPITSH